VPAPSEGRGRHLRLCRAVTEGSRGRRAFARHDDMRPQGSIITANGMRHPEECEGCRDKEDPRRRGSRRPLRNVCCQGWGTCRCAPDSSRWLPSAFPCTNVCLLPPRTPKQPFRIRPDLALPLCARRGHPIVSARISKADIYERTAQSRYATARPERPGAEWIEAPRTDDQGWGFIRPRRSASDGRLERNLTEMNRM
jgi:hypothetical protein